MRLSLSKMTSGLALLIFAAMLGPAWAATDYYQDLGLTLGATDQEVEHAYRKILRRTLPDTPAAFNSCDGVLPSDQRTKI